MSHIETFTYLDSKNILFNINEKSIETIKKSHNAE
jgi:hypothetical protein